MTQLRGVGIPTQTAAPPSELVASLGAWYYNWSAYSNVAGVEFVPMSWGGGALTNVAAYPYVLFLNEPEYASQANKTPAQAATLYREFRKQALYRNPDQKFLVAGTSAEHTDWCASFVNAYGAGLFRADGWHVHCYGGGQWGVSQAILEKFIAWWKAQPARIRGEEIWITEVGVLETGPNVAAYMTAFKTWVAANPMITRFAWFATNSMGYNGSLINAGNNALTALGVQWAGAEPPPPPPPPPPPTGEAYPTEDTWISEWTPTVTRGNDTGLKLRTGGTFKVFLRFPSTAASAVLRFYVGSKSNAGCGIITAYQPMGAWTEAALTWANAPALGPAVGSAEVCAVPGTYTMNLSGLKGGDIVLVYTSSASTEYVLGSRDSAADQKPRLTW